MSVRNLDSLTEKRRFALTIVQAGVLDWMKRIKGTGHGHSYPFASRWRMQYTSLHVPTSIPATVDCTLQLWVKQTFSSVSGFVSATRQMTNSKIDTGFRKFYYMYLFSMFASVRRWTCHSTHVEGSRRTIYRSWFSPLTAWVLRSELRSPGLVISAFICWLPRLRPWYSILI